MPISYTYDHTLDGLLSAVFAAYLYKEAPVEIVPHGLLQEAFGQNVREIETDETHARRVEKGIVAKAGSPCFTNVWTAFLSCEREKATRIYRYIRRGLEIGRGVYNNISHADVLPVENMLYAIRHEAHLLTGFTRFSEMENGAFYAKISPKNAVVPLIMPHFAERFNVQPFIVFDDIHGIAGVYDMKGWYMVETGHLDVPKPSDSEWDYRRMWKGFYEAIAIKERVNHKCRRSHMPLRFWPNMTEFGHIPPAANTRESNLLPNHPGATRHPSTGGELCPEYSQFPSLGGVPR
jgi:probable DNA metabolism protein